MKLPSLVLLACLSILSLGFAQEKNPAAAQPDRETELKALQDSLAKVEKEIADPLIGETGVRKALRELRDFNDRVNVLLEGAELTDPKDPLAVVAAGIATALKSVEERLPPEFKMAREIRPGLPTPKYGKEHNPRPIMAKLAKELDSAQRALAVFLLEGGEEPKERAGLLAKMVAAQEKLAWEEGWPFTDEEAASYRKSSGLTPEIYASRLGRGVDRVNQQLLREFNSSGRGEPGQFALYQPADEREKANFDQHLKEARGIEKKPEDLFRAFDDEAEKLLKSDSSQPRESARG